MQAQQIDCRSHSTNQVPRWGAFLLLKKLLLQEAVRINYQFIQLKKGANPILKISHSTRASETVSHLIPTPALQAQQYPLYCTIDKTGLQAVREVHETMQLVTDRGGLKPGLGDFQRCGSTFYEVMEQE